MSHDPSHHEDFSRGTPMIAYPAHWRGQEAKIDVADLLRAVWGRRWLVMAITIASIAVGFAWAMLATPIYRVEVLLAPVQSKRTPSLSGRLGGLATLAGLNVNSGGDDVHAVAVLRSRVFVESFIVDNGLLPVLFADEWDSANNTWKSSDSSEQPTLWNGVKVFTERIFSVDQDDQTGLVKLAVEWTDPGIAAKWADEMVKRINEQLRTRDLSDAERKLAFLHTELGSASLLEVRQAISSVIEEQIQTVTLAKGEAEYAFRVIDPARVPMERISPKRSLILVLSALAGGVLSLCVVLVLFLHTSRSDSAK